MIWLIGAMAVLFVVGFIVIHVLVTNRIVRTFGHATSDEAKIEMKAKEDARAIVNDGEKEKLEVMHADRVSLLSKLRDFVQSKP